ncbi:kinase-like domain-containing protein [Mycena vitilis]|nr:kinase-like domain-containing protein [Mycena vitilis]
MTRRSKPSRPATVPELLAVAQADASKPVANIDFQSLLRYVRDSREEGKVSAARALANGATEAMTTDIGRDLERAFIAHWRAADLAFDKVPSHPNYQEDLTGAQKLTLSADGQDTLQEIGRLKLLLTQRYERYARGDADPASVPVYPDTAPRRSRASQPTEDAQRREQWRNAWSEDSVRRIVPTRSENSQLPVEVGALGTDAPTERDPSRAMGLNREIPIPRDNGLDGLSGPPRRTVWFDSARNETFSLPALPSDSGATLDEDDPEVSVYDPSPTGYIRGLLAIWNSRESLSAAASQSFGHEEALERFESQICGYLTHILDSRDARHAAVLLQGRHAQCFLDAVQDVLNRGSLPTASYTTMARRLMHKLSEAHDQLPTSLFITGVYDPDEHPTFAGGFGDVYRASYDSRRVALKRIRTFSADSTNPRRLKFCREALVWQGLRHPSILPFLGIDRHTFPSSLCMVSPWMKHGTILKYLHDRGRQEIERLVLEIAQGLAYLHSMNIVHGDLRGNNILISDECTACLADFGLATTIRDDDADVTTGALSSSNRAGSMRWLAPELITPEQFGCRFVRTRATDVYAFGCVCLELETGAPPFSDVQDVPAMFKVLAGERPERPDSMSDAMWYIITAAWAEDFRQRPNTSHIIFALKD